MKKWIKFGGGIVISALFLFLIFRGVDIKTVVDIIAQARLVYLFLSLFVSGLMLVVRSYRWKMLIKEYYGFSFSNFFESTNIGLGANNVLPFRMGDFVQAYLLSRKTGLSKSLTFSTVLMERFVDFFPPILIIIIGSFFIVLPKQISLPLSCSVLAGLIVGMNFLIKFKEKILGFVEAICDKNHKFDKFYKVIQNFYFGIDSFKDSSLVLKIFFMTLLLWSGYSISVYFCCLSLGIKLPSVWSSFLIQGITVLSVVIPSSPGYIGTWEAMGILALKVLGFNQTIGLAFGILSHLVAIVPVSMFGMYYLIKEFSIIKNVEKEVEDENKSQA